MELTDYERMMFNNIMTKTVVNHWYIIEEHRPDRDEFIKTIDKFIREVGLAELNPDCTKFRRIQKFEDVVKSFDNNSGEPKVFGDPELHKFYATEYPKKEMPTCPNTRDEILKAYWSSRHPKKS